MARDDWFIGLGALAVGALLYWSARRQQGVTLPGEPEEIGTDALPGPLESIWTGLTMPELPVYDPRDYQAQQGNLRAFLDMIGVSEGADYDLLYGGGHFTDFSDHPADNPATGWKGLPLSDAQCRGAGLSPGCVSTAAGKYQIIRPTWRALKARLGLPDFSPDSQDRAATELLRENGALPLVQAGRFAEAVNASRKVWASLPGAGYGQHENALATLENVYQQAGGTVV